MVDRAEVSEHDAVRDAFASSSPARPSVTLSGYHVHALLEQLADVSEVLAIAETSKLRQISGPARRARIESTRAWATLKAARDDSARSSKTDSAAGLPVTPREQAGALAVAAAPVCVGPAATEDAMKATVKNFEPITEPKGAVIHVADAGGAIIATVIVVSHGAFGAAHEKRQSDRRIADAIAAAINGEGQAEIAGNSAVA